MTYHENNFINKLKQFTENPFFNFFILFLIFLNSILIVLQTIPEYQSIPILQIVDNIFLIIYLVEIFLRIIADNKDFLRSGWNIFDSLIIILSVLLELSSLRLLRSFKIIRVLGTARVTKTFRIMRFLPKSNNLRKIVISISRALPKIISTGFLLVIVYYIYAILGVSIYNKPDCPNCNEFFGSILRAVQTLFQAMTEDSWASSIARVLDSTHPSIWFYFISFIMITTLTILSVITGVIVESITEVSKEFDKGKNYYTRTDHIVILGFNEIALYILQQLNNYEENSSYFLSRRNVLILDDGDIDKVKISVEEKLPNAHFLNITYMKGSPSSTEDLKKCNLIPAKSIIIAESESSQYVKIILSIKTIFRSNEVLINTELWKHLKRLSRKIISIKEARAEKNRKKLPHIILAVNDTYSYESLRKAFPKNDEDNRNLHILYSKDIISRVLAHTCRKAGFADVFNELFTPEKNEIYIHPFKHRVFGKKFFAAALAYDKCALLGYVTPSNIINLNPDPNEIIPENSKGIFLTEKERFISFGKYKSNRDLKVVKVSTEFKSKDFVFFGCNHYTDLILKELDNYVGKNSTVKIFSTQQNKQAFIESSQPYLKNLNIQFSYCNHHNLAEKIDRLDEDSSSVFVFLSEDHLMDETADSFLMTNLLSAINTLRKTDQTKRILCEMQKIENQSIAPKKNNVKCLKGLEYVVGNRITCQILTQIAINPEVDDIFRELLNPEGSEIYMKKPEKYNLSGERRMNYIIKEILKRNEILLGYKKTNGEIKLNPNRKEKLDLKSIVEFIVIAKD